jgi:hypothetical protein
MKPIKLGQGDPCFAFRWSNQQGWRWWPATFVEVVTGEGELLCTSRFAVVLVWSRGRGYRRVVPWEDLEVTHPGRELEGAFLVPFPGKVVPEGVR